MNKKYELTNETIKYNGVKLYRIKSLRDFGDVSKGDLGGFVESENNLSHEGNCWIYDDGKAFDNGTVSGDGKVLEYGKVFGHGEVFDHGEVSGHGEVFGYGMVYDYGKVFGYGMVYDHGMVSNRGEISEEGMVCGYATIRGDSVVKQRVGDYIVFQITWSDGGYFTWTKSNNMWSVGRFYGTGEELIKNEYKKSNEFGKNYERYVRFVEENFLQ